MPFSLSLELFFGVSGRGQGTLSHSIFLWLVGSVHKSRSGAVFPFLHIVDKIFPFY